MKNYTALIRLHYTTSDYMRLTRVQKKQKKGERDGGGGGEEGNIHDLINYAIMCYFAGAVMHGQRIEGKQTGNSVDVSTLDREKCFHLNLDALVVTRRSLGIETPLV